MNGHKKVAIDLLADVEAYTNDAHSMRFGDEPSDRVRAALDHAGIAALSAIAESNLYLAEQTRIANLIALHRHEVEYDIGDWSRLYEHGTETLKPDIARALGIETGEETGA